MKVRIPKFSRDEHARRGQSVYEQQIRPLVEADHRGEIVAIDIETGDYELADSTLHAANRLLTRSPDAQIWCVRLGSPGVHRFGPRRRRERT